MLILGTGEAYVLGNVNYGLYIEINYEAEQHTPQCETGT